MLKGSKNRQQSERTFQVLVVGSPGCGKSALLHRAVADEFEPAYLQTIGADLVVKQFHGEDFDSCTLDLWCCGGAERYRPLLQQHYDEADVVMMVYDMTSRESFTELTFWYNERMRTMPDAHLFLVGTKADDKAGQEISTEDSQTQATSWKADHVTVSAKTGANISDLFRRLARRCLGVAPAL